MAIIVAIPDFLGERYETFFYFGGGILFMLLLGCSSTYHSAQEEIFQSACKSEADSKSSGTNVVTSNIVLPDTINNILTLYDDSIITVSLTGDEKIAATMYYPMSGKRTSIGAIGSFITYSSPVLINDNLFINLTVNKTDEGFFNSLYRVNLQEKTVRLIDSVVTYQTQVLTKRRDNGIITLAGYLKEESNITQLSVIDLESNFKHVGLEKEYNLNSKSGESIWDFAYDDNYYVLTSRSSESRTEYLLEEYDEQFNFIVSYDFSQIMGLLNYEPIKDFFVYQDFLFIQSISRNSVLCRLDGMILQPVICGNADFPIKVAQTEKGKLYFALANTHQVITIDNKSLFLYEYDWKEYFLNDILASEGYLLLFFQDDFGVNKRVFCDIDSFLINPIPLTDSKYDISNKGVIFNQ